MRKRYSGRKFKIGARVVVVKSSLSNLGRLGTVVRYGSKNPKLPYVVKLDHNIVQKSLFRFNPRELSAAG